MWLDRKGLLSQRKRLKVGHPPDPMSKRKAKKRQPKVALFCKRIWNKNVKNCRCAKCSEQRKVMRRGGTATSGVS